MRGTVHTHHQGRWARPAVLTLIVLGALLVAAPAALAFDPLDVECDNGANTIHGDGTITATCFACHGVVSPVEPITPVDTKKCVVCHQGGYENRVAPSLYTSCWSCHRPGDPDLDAVQTSEGCAAATDCHPAAAGQPGPHYGSETKGCVDGCHRTSSQSLPNGSPHHDDGLPGCYDCHDGAQALEKVHEPYVSTRKVIFSRYAANCDTCHIGYTLTHADPAAIDHTATAPKATTPIVYGASTVVWGVLKKVLPDGTVLGIISGASVTIVQRPVPELDWNTVMVGLVPMAPVLTDGSGKYTFAPVSPTKNTAYAAIAQGKVVGDRIFKPARGTILVKVAPKVTETVVPTSFVLGKSTTVTGTIRPAGTGGSVKWRFQRLVDGSWVTVTTTAATVLVDNLEGTLSTAVRKYTPAKRGTWRVRTEFVANKQYAAAVSTWVKFYVK